MRTAKRSARRSPPRSNQLSFVKRSDSVDKRRRATHQLHKRQMIQLFDSVYLLDGTVGKRPIYLPLLIGEWGSCPSRYRMLLSSRRPDSTGTRAIGDSAGAVALHYQHSSGFGPCGWERGNEEMVPQRNSFLRGCRSLSDRPSSDSFCH